MTHSFNVELAVKYGIEASLIIGQIDYWCRKNKEKNINFYEGRYWTFNSMKDMSKMFPYMTERQIRYNLENLRKEELLLTANFNKIKRDRTIWYALSNKALYILQNCQMQLTKLSNGNDKIVKCIYKDIPNLKQIKERNKQERKDRDSFYSEER